MAYALLFGAARHLEVPDTDLNVTITKGRIGDSTAIVLYDNVPGGAGLVDRLKSESVLKKVFQAAQERVNGSCRCELSCYGCLRTYRNQFVHSDLDRTAAKKLLVL